jgi:hypothetical protein
MKSTDDKTQEVIKIIKKELGSYLPYLWHEAKTGSMYIKFPHWGLGSIRIGDHKGLSKYPYRWEIRMDKNNCFDIISTKKASQVVVSPDNIKLLLNEFKWSAIFRKIKPGDKQTWEEHKGIETPEYKKKKYNNPRDL